MTERHRHKLAMNIKWATVVSYLHDSARLALSQLSDTEVDGFRVRVGDSDNGREDPGAHANGQETDIVEGLPDLKRIPEGAELFGDEADDGDKCDQEDRAKGEIEVVHRFFVVQLESVVVYVVVLSLVCMLELYCLNEGHEQQAG